MTGLLSAVDFSTSAESIEPIFHDENRSRDHEILLARCISQILYIFCFLFLRKNGPFRNYSTASVDDFWEAMAEETVGLPAEVALSEVLDFWISHRGYPIVRTVRNYEDGSVTIRQVWHKP